MFFSFVKSKVIQLGFASSVHLLQEGTRRLVTEYMPLMDTSPSRYIPLVTVLPFPVSFIAISHWVLVTQGGGGAIGGDAIGGGAIGGAVVTTPSLTRFNPFLILDARRRRLRRDRKSGSAEDSGLVEDAASAVQPLVETYSARCSTGWLVGCTVETCSV